MKKTPLMIQVDIVDRNRIEMLSAKWGGISLSATVRKVLEEYVTHIDTATPPPEPEPTQEELDFAARKKKNANVGAWMH
jgi:hypothetical protein